MRRAAVNDRGPTWILREFGGACGDLGTFIPHVIGAMTVAGLAPVGVLFGFGVQTVLLFAGYEFYARSPDRAGPGGAVGILGGIVLLVAALIAAASRPASAAVTSGSASG